jgi:hypothetical protein
MFVSGAHDEPRLAAVVSTAKPLGERPPSSLSV